MAVRRGTGMRRLQDNYSKLTPEQQRGMGYGTIVKAQKESKPKVSADVPPPPKKAKEPRSVASRDDAAAITRRIVDEQTIPEADIKRGRGLSGLKKAMGYE